MTWEILALFCDFPRLCIIDATGAAKVTFGVRKSFGKQLTGTVASKMDAEFIGAARLQHEVYGLQGSYTY